MTSQSESLPLLVACAVDGLAGWLPFFGGRGDRERDFTGLDSPCCVSDLFALLGEGDRWSSSLSSRSDPLSLLVARAVDGLTERLLLLGMVAPCVVGAFGVTHSAWCRCCV